MKHCDRCKETKPLELFAKHPGAKDGRQGICKVCRHAARMLRLHTPEGAEKHRRQQRVRRENLPGEAREKNRIKARNWYTNNTERKKIGAKRRQQALRMEMITAYGGKCVCCAESNPGFLTLDHVNGGGRVHRKEVGNIRYDLKQKGWPTEGFQILCYNCNCGRAHNGGVCPHEVEKFDA